MGGAAQSGGGGSPGQHQPLPPASPARTSLPGEAGEALLSRLLPQVGVVLLDHAAALIAPHLAGRALRGAPVVKFTRPVRPGEAVQVGFRDGGDGRVAFRCDVDGAACLTGTFQFD